LALLRLVHSHWKYTVWFFSPGNHLVYLRPSWLHLCVPLGTTPTIAWSGWRKIKIPHSVSGPLIKTTIFWIQWSIDSPSTTICSNKLLGPLSIYVLELLTVWLRHRGLTWDRVKRLCMITPFSERLWRPPCSRSTTTTAEVTFSPSDCRSFNRNILTE
jgi:hypothetical protein